MSNIPDRLYRISKAYLGQVRDRFDAELAERELDMAAHSDPNAPASDDASHEATMQRAEMRIAQARRDLESSRELNEARNKPSVPAPPVPTTTVSPVKTEEDPNAADYRLLGVDIGADLPTVLSAYEKLSRRCDPRRFPDGSGEQKDAAQILARVNTAYENLRKRLDPTVNRFGKLEFE